MTAKSYTEEETREIAERQHLVGYPYLALMREKLSVKAKSEPKFRFYNLKRLVVETESEESHRLDGQDLLSGENIYGKAYGWRDTRRFFTYRLAAGEGDKPLTLVARYRVCETGPRQFDVQVDGKTIFTEDLKNSGKRGFFYREMSIPKELTSGKKNVEVKFAAKPGNIAGGLFGLWLVR